MAPIDAATFRNIAKAQIPAVVNIQTQAQLRNRDLTDFNGDDLFRRFFGGAVRGGPQPGSQGRSPRGRRSRERG